MREFIFEDYLEFVQKIWRDDWQHTDPGGFESQLASIADAFDDAGTNGWGLLISISSQWE
ncbi:MAG: hypothetical protein M3463_04385 [Verrucomicrobiota bacterium]|nr:hypothetical protein [Verrucomicrobiota bacterium]